MKLNSNAFHALFGWCLCLVLCILLICLDFTWYADFWCHILLFITLKALSLIGNGFLSNRSTLASFFFNEHTRSALIFLFYLCLLYKSIHFKDSRRLSHIALSISYPTRLNHFCLSVTLYDSWFGTKEMSALALIISFNIGTGKLRSCGTYVRSACKILIFILIIWL